MRLDVSEVLRDPLLAGGRFDVVQTFVDTGEDGRRKTTTKRITGATGSIQPSRGDELERLNSAERLNGAITIISRHPLTCGDGQKRTADEVFWKNQTYIVMMVDPWMFGRGYVLAVATIKALHGETSRRPT